ncbi:MAG: 50S ribosomal protein L10 [Candidatus Hodgkinia cicadicola]
MLVRSNLNHLRFHEASSLVKRHKTFLLLIFKRVEVNRFTKLRMALSSFNAKLHFVKTNHINLALDGLFSRGIPRVKGQCLLVTIPSFEFEVFKHLNSFVKVNGLTPLILVRDGLLQPIVDFNVFSKFKTPSAVKLALVNCLQSYPRGIVQLFQTSFAKLVLSFPRKLS